MEDGVSTVDKKDAEPDIVKLKRLLYLSHTWPTYVAGNPELHFFKEPKTRLEFLSSFTSSQFLKTLEQASLDELLPRRVTLFYALAHMLCNTENEDSTRNHLAKAALKICRTDEEFFKFISLFTKFNKEHTNNKITSAVGKVFNAYLNSKSNLEYATSVGKSTGYHGWKFKDLIKLSHFKGSTVEKTLITSYVLFGLEKLKDVESTGMKNIVSLLQKWEELRKTEDEWIAAVLVKELHADFSQVNPKFIKSEVVWSAIIPELPIREVLRLLPKFYKLGLLNAKTKVHDTVTEALTSLERIKSCKLNPVEVFIHLKNFEKGGKPMDPKLEAYLKSKKDASGDVKEKPDKTRSEPKSIHHNSIIASIGKCLNLSYPKDPYTMGMGKRIVLALDLTQHSEAVCFQNKNITCLEAELALTLYYFKTEKNINVTVFNNKDVKGFNLDKNAPFAQSLKKLKDNKSEYMILPSVFDWAINKKKKVDVFICLIQTCISVIKGPKDGKMTSFSSVIEAFTKYKNKMSLPSSKLVVICLGTHNLAGFDDVNALTICGFCPEIPNLVRAFVAGSFS